MRYLLLFLPLLFSSCKQTQIEYHKFVSVWPKNIDTSYVKEYRKRFLYNLNLHDISSGVDSFEIRFSYNYAMVVEKDLFVIKYSNGKWSGLHYAFQNTEVDDSLTFIKREFSPIHSWEKLIDSIYSSDILNIPSQVDLKDYKNRVSDGEYFTMEYATKDKFKLILYENPDHYPEYGESKIVSNFIEMFYRNLLQGERCWPRCQK